MERREDFDRLVAERSAAWRADPSLIEQTVDAMALHGEYRAWWR